MAPNPQFTGNGEIDDVESTGRLNAPKGNRIGYTLMTAPEAAAVPKTWAKSVFAGFFHWQTHSEAE